jgi:signal transduction histidine kinase
MYPGITRARHRLSDVLDQVSGARAVRLLARVLEGLGAVRDRLRMLTAAIHDLRTSLNRRLDHLEKQMSATRDEFSADLAELGAAITELDSRIGQLPDRVDQLTQDDLDSIKGLTGRVNSLAVASPQVPTEPTGVTPAEAEPTEADPVPAPVVDESPAVSDETPVEAPAESSGDTRA